MKYNIEKYSEELNCTISTFLSGSLLNKLKDIIISNKVANNYKYISVSDLLREILTEYKNGMILITQDTKEKKQLVTFKVSQELYNFYLTFPKKARSEIFEKVIRVYLQLDSF